jgi:cell wall-associated NlpC family hydrolase
VSSQPVKRTIRGALAVTAVAVAFIGSAPMVHAQPSDASEALKKYTDLSHEAEKLNEDHLKAQDGLKAAEEALGKANADFTTASAAEDQAKAAEEQFRGQVDLLTEASFQGARFSSLSALLVSQTQQDFLNRMSAIRVLAADNSEALGKLSSAVTSADEARRAAVDARARAAKATDDAAAAVREIDARKAALDGQIDEARRAYSSLSGADKATLGSNGDMGPVVLPAGTDPAVNTAVQYALAQRGKPYVFGSNGPNSWDCSSLMQASYRQAGISIGRTTYAQAAQGRAVSRNDVKAGDLIIYYADQGHVSMAIDNIRAVHASTEGVPVRIANIESIGPVNTIRRIVG